MKKLVTGVFAVALSAIANAAQYNWSTMYEIGNATDGGGVTSANMAYLINASVLSANDIYSALSAGASLADVVSGKTINSATLNNGKITTQSKVDLPSTYSAGDKLAMYMVLIDDDLSAVYFSDQISRTLNVSVAQTYAFTSNSSIDAVAANMSGFDSSKGGWVAVPEPTSGLLLLLGMAGLALKRKHG